ncbi:MAG: tetratricopeptide repeat protein [Candidatus Lokiarchaeota archaeon]|nr:tetratricopeptide repeat protein [Candidatus Lokiarchaeota archaeon]
MLEFRINDYITLRLEHNHTTIYVNNEIFDQCRKILFINPHNNEKQKMLDSIDEAIEILSDHPPVDYRSSDFYITPEMEFWAHCSNLQAWVENDYDTRILHSNLAFPLLKKLVELGDTKAFHVFKEEIARRFLSGFPPVIQFLLNQGYLEYLNKEELEVLLDEFENILDNPISDLHDVKNSAILTNLTDYYLKRGLYYNFVRSIKLAAKETSLDKRTLNKLGEAYIFLEKFHKAIDVLKKCIELPPFDPKPYLELAYIYDEIGEYDNAKVMCNTVLNFHYYNKIAWIKLGDIYIHNNEYDKAIEACNIALSIDDQNPIPWCTLGSAYFYKGKYERAIELVKNSMEIDPKYVDGWKTLGDIYSTINDLDNAIDAYRTLTLFRPTHIGAWYDLAEIYFKMELYNESMKACKKCLELDSKFEKASILLQKLKALNI